LIPSSGILGFLLVKKDVNLPIDEKKKKKKKSGIVIINHTAIHKFSA
jgi:hypothetical protein